MILGLLYILTSSAIGPLLSATIVGYLFTRRWYNFCLNINPETIKSIEASCFCRKLSAMKSFVQIVNTSSQIPSQEVGQNENISSIPFSGKGVVIGTSSGNERGVSSLIRENEQRKINELKASHSIVI